MKNLLIGLFVLALMSSFVIAGASGEVRMIGGGTGVYFADDMGKVTIADGMGIVNVESATIAKAMTGDNWGRVDTEGVIVYKATNYDPEDGGKIRPISPSIVTDLI